MAQFFSPNNSDMTALEFGLCGGGAIGTIIIVVLLYKPFLRWVARRRAAVARCNAVKTIRTLALAELCDELPPGNEALECAVCLEDYVEEEEVAKLHCGHHYAGWPRDSLRAQSA